MNSLLECVELSPMAQFTLDMLDLKTCETELIVTSGAWFHVKPVNLRRVLAQALPDEYVDRRTDIPRFCLPCPDIPARTMILTAHWHCMDDDRDCAAYGETMKVRLRRLWLLPENLLRAEVALCLLEEC